MLSAGHFLTYLIVSKLRYKATRFKYYFSWNKFKEIVGFSGWNMFGVAAWASSDIMLNLFLNNFFGPIVNAARGVAMQVANATSGFTQNFLTAVRPQIVQKWAIGKKMGLKQLFYRASKGGYFCSFFCTACITGTRV